AREPGERRQDPAFRRGRPLRLHPDKTLDRPERGEPAALQQQLARERGAIQIRQRQRPPPHPTYATAMAVRVRMAPSPTGLLHIGNVRTALFNWLYARHEDGEFRRWIESTDPSGEVAEAVDQIQDSLRWLGLNWDGPHTFQLDRMDDCRRVADEILGEGNAYEDDGEIRLRMHGDGARGC